METQVKAWLKAGIWKNFQKQNNGKIFRKPKGTPHDGIYLLYYLILLSMEWKNI
jgi:hypothetical protein